MNSSRSTILTLAAVGLALGLLAPAHAATKRPSFVSQQTSTIEGIGDYTSMQLDQMGRTHVAYFDQARDALVYAFQTQTGWRTELVDADGMVGWYASLALDSRGDAHVAYYDATRGALKYAARTGGVWTAQVVDASAEGVGHYCSLALDASDQPAISYYDATNLSLRFAARVNGSWQTETVDGAQNAAATEEAIVQAGQGSKAPAASEEVPNVGHYTSLAIGRDGTAHISYQDITRADLKYAVQRGGEWVTETVDAAGNVGEHTSLALDADGQPHISYYDLQTGALKFAELKAGEWQKLAVDATGDVGAYSSLELDATGAAHISYMDAKAGALKYAQEQDGVWMVAVLDASGATGRNTSLSLDRSGAPVIAYTARGSKGSFKVVSASVQFGGRPASQDAGVATARSLSAWPLPYKGGELNVSFVIPSRGGKAEVALLDLAGRRVRTLQSGTLEAGRQVLTWNGRDDAGRTVPNGVYFLTTRMGGQESRLKLVVLR